jgi:hypothetical protein
MIYIIIHGQKQYCPVTLLVPSVRASWPNLSPLHSSDASRTLVMVRFCEALAAKCREFIVSVIMMNTIETE